MPLTKVQTEMAGTGAVLQVVSNQISISQASTTSTSYVTTGISLAITPKFSTSKIYICISVNTFCTPNLGRYTVYRNSTNVDSSSGGLSVSGNSYANNVISVLDSPATTSSTTYTLYFKADSGSIYAGITGTTNTITLMEIAG